MGLSTLWLAVVRLRHQWVLAVAQGLGLIAAVTPAVTVPLEAADSGTAILFATHDESATEVADRVVRMEDGVLTPSSGLVASAESR